ncbi:MAG: hypothetical protein QM572_06660 [Nocardioides sp.]|uniref:hypothetical protein n=1 Tax=Nocardioides sp. TaxID=35761 RepID=UPI0039E4C571
MSLRAGAAPFPTRSPPGSDGVPCDHAAHEAGPRAGDTREMTDLAGNAAKPVRVAVRVRG